MIKQSAPMIIGVTNELSLKYCMCSSLYEVYRNIKSLGTSDACMRQ